MFLIPIIMSMLSFAYAPKEQDLDDRRNSVVSDMSLVSELEAGEAKQNVITELRPEFQKVSIPVQPVGSAQSGESSGTLVSQAHHIGTNLTKHVVEGAKVIEGLKQTAEQAEQALKESSKGGSGSPMCCRRRKEAPKEMNV